MIGQNDGVKNEVIISNYINRKLYGRLSAYWRDFIKEFDPSVDNSTLLECKKIGGKGLKPDIIVKTQKQECAISIKKGRGNSVHQEKTSQFIEYCKLFLGMSDYEADCLKKFLYGDGTNDGSAPREDRLDIEQVKDVYSKEIETVQIFLNKHKEDLLYRFLVYGKYGIKAKKKADYIFHGTVEGGVSCPLNSYMIEELSKMSYGDNNALSIGPLSLQVWNRNPSESEEKRRHSIQIKWTTCEKDLRALREKSINYSESIEKKVFGDNSHGFDNQRKIVNYFSDSKVGDYTDVAKRLLFDINPRAQKTDKVDADGIHEKASVQVTVGSETRKLSVFLGSGNSVHQEKVSGFIEYCESIGMTNEEKIAFLKVHYADGTIDGTGEINNRLDGKKQIRKQYMDEIAIAQRFINAHKRELLERFLVYGKDKESNSHGVDYIYYGTYENGVYASSNSVIDYLIEIENSTNAVLAVGPLSIQMWNRNLSGRKDYEYKRESIQVKWGKLQKHLCNVYELNLINYVRQNGTIQGTNEEYNLVRMLNLQRDINNELWNVICNVTELDDISDIYAIRVTSRVMSNLSGRHVYPKSDVYLAKIDLSEEDLLDNNFIIDEDMFEEKFSNKSITRICGSGISCKIKESKNYTYEKLTIASFLALFHDKMIGAGMCLFVKNDEELQLNKDVISAWDISYDEFMYHWKKELSLEKIEDIFSDKEICKMIKKESEKRIRGIIDTNDTIKKAIFKGEGIFEEPYNASLIYSNGVIKINDIDNYSITTGSGRHKGNYTIVIKP